MFAVVGVEDHDNHYLARRRGADYHVAHQSRVFAGVVERVAALEAETFRLGADGVRRVALQIAQVDVEHLVEAVGDVESQRGSAFDVAARRDLLVREPAFVGEGELQFVAVEGLFRRAQTRAHLGQLDLADAGQLVAHLLGLEPQLFRVGQVLPLAASAHPEVGAERLLAQRRFTKLTATPSMKRRRLLRICTSTTSPGTVIGTNTTCSLYRPIALPSAARVVISNPSIKG